MGVTASYTIFNYKLTPGPSRFESKINQYLIKLKNQDQKHALLMYVGFNKYLIKSVQTNEDL